MHNRKETKYGCFRWMSGNETKVAISGFKWFSNYSITDFILKREWVNEWYLRLLLPLTCIPNNFVVVVVALLNISIPKNCNRFPSGVPQTKLKHSWESWRIFPFYIIVYINFEVIVPRFHSISVSFEWFEWIFRQIADNVNAVPLYGNKTRHDKSNASVLSRLYSVEVN